MHDLTENKPSIHFDAIISQQVTSLNFCHLHKVIRRKIFAAINSTSAKSFSLFSDKISFIINLRIPINN